MFSKFVHIITSILQHLFHIYMLVTSE